jgi:hypothetical protein
MFLEELRKTMKKPLRIGSVSAEIRIVYLPECKFRALRLDRPVVFRVHGLYISSYCDVRYGNRFNFTENKQNNYIITAKPVYVGHIWFDSNEAILKM